MSALDFRLAQPPEDPRRRELWLQHAAGFILLENVRAKALREIDRAASPEARAAAEKAVDDTMFALMNLIDGENWLDNDEHEVTLTLVAALKRKADEQELYRLDLDQGDGFGMGFHGWKEGDYGKDPIIARP